MEPTIEILIGAPVSGSEAAALRDLVAALHAPALVLANFEIVSGGASHQIDFVVVTDKRDELIELKAITAPVRGGANGTWQIETSPGFFVPYDGPNPWEQARDAKLALSDAMHDHARRRSGVPKPARRRYFEQLDASVSVYPLLKPGSQVFAGNFKAWVRSFPDTVEALTVRPLPIRSTWGTQDWRAFAIAHLGLSPATLSEAIDPAVFHARRLLDDYTARLCKSELAPLLPASDKELIGEKIIDRLGGPADVLLVGRSGLGKSFHLEHYRRRCFAADEIPILVQALHYERDLNRAIHKSTVQYTRLTPAELLDVAKRLGKRPVLIVDAWNDCPQARQADFGDALAAFKLRYDARLVIASQARPSHSLYSAVTTIELGSLRQEHKGAICAFHAGRTVESIPVHWYEPFSTAFDLSIAGRCQRDGAVSRTRADLYDVYVRSVVPSLTARSLLRKLAWHMGEHFKPAFSISDYECVVEKFVQEMGISITVAEDVLKSPLLNADRQVITFKHDLLRDYFRFEHFFRETAMDDLPARLNEPKYAGLAEFVIPWLPDEHIVQRLLLDSSVDLLNAAYRGWLGMIAEHIARDHCERLLAKCRDQLSEITIEAVPQQLEDGCRFLHGAYVVGPTCATDQDAKFCAVIAANLADPGLRYVFLELLDIGEWALKESSARTAREHHLRPTAVWRELLHQNVILSHTHSVHPVLLICQQLRENHSISAGLSNRLPIRDELLERVRMGNAGALQLLLLMHDLRYSDSICTSDALAIVRQAWDSTIESLRVESLEFVHSIAGAICERGREAENAMIALLDSFDVKNNVMLSTQWLEARSLFSGFGIGIDVNDALDEFRNILARADAGDDPMFQMEHEADPTVSFAQFVASWASNALSKIFEDVYQGIYCEAYELLSEEERTSLLTLALREPRVGFFTDWYLRQLCKTGCRHAPDILVRFGSRLEPDAFYPQDSVECFVMAHETWARIADEPISYRDSDSEDHSVWAITGELIFWLNRNDGGQPGRVSFLCNELLRFPKAVPDVLQQLGRCHKGMGPSPALSLLLSRHADSIRTALHASLSVVGALTSVFRFPPRQPDLLRFIMSTLGDIGDRGSVSLLLPWTKIGGFGREAIRAIEEIEQRLAT